MSVAKTGGGEGKNGRPAIDGGQEVRRNLLSLGENGGGTRNRGDTASKKIQNLSAEALVSLAGQMIAAIGTGETNPYGFSKTQTDAIATDKTALVAANGAVAKAAYHAAVQDRDAKAGATTHAVADLARTAYANAAVTSTMIAALGLQPRASRGTKVVPTTPIHLTGTPMPNGDIRLAWNCYGNAASVNFIVEAQTGAGEWAFVQDTTVAKITLWGYAPGVAVSFRVSASKNKVVSATVSPSSVAAPAASGRRGRS